MITKTLPALPDKEIFDDEGAYPDLYEGESKKVRWGNSGYTSEGYLIKVKNGKRIKTKIRSDKYSPTRGLIVWGKAKRAVEDEQLAVLP